MGLVCSGRHHRRDPGRLSHLSAGESGKPESTRKENRVRCRCQAVPAVRNKRIHHVVHRCCPAASVPIHVRTDDRRYHAVSAQNLPLGTHCWPRAPLLRHGVVEQAIWTADDRFVGAKLSASIVHSDRAGCNWRHWRVGLLSLLPWAEAPRVGWLRRLPQGSTMIWLST